MSNIKNTIAMGSILPENLVKSLIPTAPILFHRLHFTFAKMRTKVRTTPKWKTPFPSDRPEVNLMLREDTLP